MRRTSILIAALLVLIASHIGGCTLVRFTTKEVPPGGTDDLRAYAARGLKVEDGETTLEQLKKVLGSPDYIGESGQDMAYRWQTVRYEKSYPDYLNRDPAQGVLAKVIYFSLLLRVGEGGLVQTHRKFRHKVEYGGPPSLPALLTQWQAEMASR